MKYREKRWWTYASGVAMVAASVLLTQASGVEPQSGGPESLRGPEAFETIRDKGRRSAALFEEAGKVLLHPRCVNCHPAGDRPLQGDDQRLHMPLVLRGLGGHGVAGMRCAGCHHNENFDPASVPGDPHWHLAPASMAWQGKTLGEICEQIKDPNRNGGRSLSEIVRHMKEDSLVGWAWSPGGNRQPAPGDQRLFGRIIEAWAKSGAVCPE